MARYIVFKSSDVTELVESYVVNDDAMVKYLPIVQNPFLYMSANPLSPHDALKHDFTYLKTDLILLKPRGFKRKI